MQTSIRDEPTLSVVGGIATTSLLSSALLAWFGQSGVFIAIAPGGFTNPHAASASIASLVKAEQPQEVRAVLPALAAVTINACSKFLVAWANGGAKLLVKVRDNGPAYRC